jgi:hypothetical protein
VSRRRAVVTSRKGMGSIRQPLRGRNTKGSNEGNDDADCVAVLWRVDIRPA